MTTDNDNITGSIPKWSSLSIKTRLVVALCALILWGVIGAAVYAGPSEEGYGTHTQLGLPKCGWLRDKGTPCPTCGMTTSYSLTVRGKILTALYTQPAGCILAITHIVLTLLMSWISIKGKYPSNLIIMINFYSIKILIITIIIILAGWGWTYIRLKGNI